MNMGERIKQLRLSNGLTQEELGKYIGVQKAAIRKYEKGEVKNMKRSSIQILSNLFKVSPSYLMCLDEESVLKEKENNKTLDVIIAEKIFEQNIDKFSEFNLDKEQIIDIKNLLIYSNDSSYSKPVQINKYVFNSFGENTNLYEIIISVYDSIEFTKKILKSILTNCDTLEYDKIINLSGFSDLEFEEVEKYIDYLISKRIN